METDIVSDHPLVIVVEDEPIIRMDAVQSLEDEGFEVVDADDVEQALEALHERPDVSAIFTDVHMPGPMNGFEFAHLVHRERPDVPVLITSGVMKLEIGDLPEHGLFIPKPYDVTQLGKLIRSMINLQPGGHAGLATA